MSEREGMRMGIFGKFLSAGARREYEMAMRAAAKEYWFCNSNENLLTSHVQWVTREDVSREENVEEVKSLARSCVA